MDTEGGGDALPDGIVPLPELGVGVVGTRIEEPRIPFLWAKGTGWLVLAAVGVVVAVQAAGSLVGLLVGAVLVLACGFLAATNILLARHGRRPALVIDADSLHCLVPLNRTSVRLDAITRVQPVRRDLLIEARGGITRHGRLTGARWVGLNGVHAFDVSRKDLAAYVSGRASRVHG